MGCFYFRIVTVKQDVFKGILHREAFEHVPFKVEFETKAMLNNKNYPELMANRM